jgi:hypothetical protein
MIAPAFVVASTPRSGSTALYRALNLVPGVQACFEPMFDDIELCPAAVVERVKLVLNDSSGFKHVYRPTGYPFRPVHDAPIDEMERRLPLWIELNTALLNFPGLRIIFLARRNGFQRVVSDLVASSTDHWGASDTPVSADEPALYKTAVAQLPLRPLDEKLLRWYLEHVPRMQDAVRSAIRVNPVLDIWYEDFFGPGVALRDRLDRFARLLDFLEIPPHAGFFRSTELALLLRPSAKLNDAAIFNRIPNYHRLCAEFDPAGCPPPPVPPVVEPEAASIPAPAIRFPGIEAGLGKARLRVGGDNLAGLEFPSGETAIRVAIARLVTDRTYDVQLNIPIGRLLANRSYQLHFRARADQPRTIVAGIAQAHDPWSGLGLYEEVELSSEWREFHHQFTANATDEEARIHFDLGSAAASVELSGIRFG